MKFGICGGENLFSAAAENGFDYVEMPAPEFRDRTESGLHALASAAESLGLRIEGANCFFSGVDSLYGLQKSEIMSFAGRTLYSAKAVGTSFCVIGSGKARSVPQGMGKEEALRRFSETVNELGGLASSYGIEIIIEPLSYAETDIINTISEGVDLCRALDSKNVGCLVDFYHFFLNGEDLSEFDRIKPGDIRHVHITRPNRDRGVPLDGDAPVLRLWAESLKKIGYDGRMTFECSWHPGFEKTAPLAKKQTYIFS